jgi:Trk K+ transport system NAD-binding subunit
LGIPDDAVIPLIIRDGKRAIIPCGDTKLEPGDQVIVVTSEASQETIRHILTG